MSDVDTSREAVERVAAVFDDDLLKILLALAAERDALRARVENLSRPVVAPAGHRPVMGSGFAPKGGGFAEIIVGGVRVPAQEILTPAEVHAALATARIEGAEEMREAVALLLADGRTAGADGVPRVGRQSRKKAAVILRDLRAMGVLAGPGEVVVPRDPTEAMLVAAGKSPDGVSARGGTDYLGRMLPRYWAAMIAAALLARATDMEASDGE